MASEECSSAPALSSVISFSFTKRSSAPNAKTKGPGGGEGDKDLVFSLEAGCIKSSKPPAENEYVIPLIHRTIWRHPGKEQGREGAPGGAPGGEEKVKTEDELTLDREAAEAIVNELQGSQSQSKGSEEGPVIPLLLRDKPLLLQNKPPVVEEQDTGKLPDLHLYPDTSSMDDYDEMPLEEFGKAMLKGMGWNPGQALDKNNIGMVEPIEFIPRMGKLGLGAAPKPQMPGRKKIKKPGEVEKKPQRPYIGADGRVKHYRRIGAEIPEQPVEGFQPGNYARVLRGPHVGLCGKIVMLDEDNSRVALKLVINGQVIDFSQHYVELVTREEDPQQPTKPSDTKKVYGLIKKNEEKMDSQPSTSRSVYEDSDEHRASTSSSLSWSRQLSERKRKSEKHHTDPSDSVVSASKKKKIDSKDSVEAASRHDNDSSIHKRLWVAPNLRVRVVDTAFRGGKFYNSKVTIVDVISGDRCVCQTNDERYLEGIQQSMLETLVPKTSGSVVMLVGGKQKGQIATLLERNSRKCRATVQVVESSEVLTVDYDDLCEYIGDVEDF